MSIRGCPWVNAAGDPARLRRRRRHAYARLQVALLALRAPDPEAASFLLVGRAAAKLAASHRGGGRAWLFEGRLQAFVHERDAVVVPGAEKICQTLVSFCVNSNGSDR